MSTLLDFMDEKIKTKVRVDGKVVVKKIEPKKLKGCQYSGLPREYSDGYAVKLLTTDYWIFDIRFWPDGVITKEYVKKCFESGTWHTNSGHFNYVMAQQRRDITWEQFWHVFQREMVKAFRKFISNAELGVQRQEKLMASDRRNTDFHSRSITYDREQIVAYNHLLNGEPTNLEANERFRPAYSMQTLEKSENDLS